MSFWTKVQEQASQRLQQSKEQLSATIQRSTPRQSPLKPSEGGQVDDPGGEDRISQRSQNEAYSFFDGDYEARNAAAKQQQLQQNHEKTELARLQQANRLLEAKIDMLRSNLEAARASKSGISPAEGADVQQLQAALADAQHQIAQLEETSTLFKEQHVAAIQAAAASQKQVQQMQHELVAAQAEVAKLDKTKARLQAEAQQHQETEQSESSSPQEEALQRMQSQLHAVQLEIIALTKGNEQLRAQVAAVTGRLEHSQKALAASHAEMEILRKKASSNTSLLEQQAAEVHTLQRKRTELEQKIAELNGYRQEAGQASALQRRLERQASELEGLRAKMAKSAEQNASMKLHIQSAESSAAEGRRKIAELQKADKAQASVACFGDGGTHAPPDLASETSQEISSPTRLLRSLNSAPQPSSPSSTGSPSSRDPASLAHEVKQLKAQLQMATEKWARDKQMFAEDARELQRVSRLKDQLGSQIAVLRAQAEQHHDMSTELHEVKECLTVSNRQAAEYQEIKAILANWDSSDSGPGEHKAHPEEGNLPEQLLLRKAKLEALEMQAKAAAEEALKAESDLQACARELVQAKAQQEQEKGARDEAQRATTAAEAQCSQLTTELDQARSLASESMRALEAVNSQHSQFITEHAEPKRDSSDIHASSNEKSQELTRELSATRQQLASAITKLQEGQAESQQAQELEPATARALDHSKQVHELQSQLAADHAPSIAQQESWPQQLQDARTEAQPPQQQVSALTDQVTQLQAQLAKADSEHAQEATALRQDVERLKQKLQQLQKQASDAQEQNHKSRGGLDKLASRADNHAVRDDDVPKTTDRLQAEVENVKEYAEPIEQQLDNRAARLTEEIERLQLQLQQAASLHSESLQSQVQELQELLLNVQQENSRQAAELRDKEHQLKQVQEHEEEVSKHQAQLQHSQHVEKELLTEVEELRDVNRQLQTIAQRAEAEAAEERNKLELQNRNLQQRMEDLLGKLATAAGEASQSRQTIAQLQGQLKSLQHQRQEWEDRHREERTVVNQLRREVAALQTQLDNYTHRSTTAEQQRQSDEAQQEALELRKQLAILISELETARHDVDTIEKAADAANSCAKHAAEDAKKADQRADHLEQEKLLLQEQVKGLDKTWQAERAGLKDKLERLQKSNRQRRQEADDMQMQLLAVQDMAAKGQEAREKLLAAREQIESLTGHLAAAARTEAELSNTRSELQEAESRHTAAMTSAQREAAHMHGALTAAEQERDQLQQEVALLKSASVAKDALQAQVARLTNDLQAATDCVHEAQKEHQRAESAEQRLRQAQSDASKASQLLTQAQRKQHTAEQQAEVAADALEKERREQALDAQRFATEMEDLASRDRSVWPQSLRTLYQQSNADAAQEAAASAQAKADATEERLESELKAARDEARAAAAKQQEGEAARHIAGARIAALEAELREREAAFSNSIAEQLQREQAASEAKCQALEERVTTAERELADCRTAADEAQASSDAAAKQLVEVKQRARGLLEEKDAQLQAARALAPSRTGSGDPLSPLPVSRSATGDVVTPRAENLDSATELSPMLGERPTSGQLLPLPGPQMSQTMEIEPANEAPGTRPLPATSPVQALQMRVKMLEHELQESERTHQLRDRAQEVAKAEIAALQRSKAREGLDVEYLKAVVLKSFESGELPSTSSMLPVLARLLHFSTDEMRKAQTPQKEFRPAKK